MGRPATVLKNLDAHLREEINEAIRSNAHEKPIDIYRRFGLAQRNIKERTFYTYVERIRAAMKASGQVAVADAVAELQETRLERAERALNLAAETMSSCLLAGDYEGASMVAKTITATVTVMKFSIEEAANVRAAELHRVKFEALKKTLRTDVDKKTEGGKTLAREDVYDLIDQAMRS